MSPDETEYGYRHDDSGGVVGPFRSKTTAIRRVNEEDDRVLMERPIGSIDPQAWEEVIK